MTNTDTDTVGLRRSDSPEDRPSVQTYIQAAQAEATRRAYAKDVVHFIAWGGSVTDGSIEAELSLLVFVPER